MPCWKGSPKSLGGEVRRLIKEALASDPPPWEPLAQIPLTEDELLFLYAITRNTVVPTMIHGGSRINVIPSEIVVDIDGRTLPGPTRTPSAMVQGAVGDAARVDLVVPATGTAADVESPFYDAIVATMADRPGREHDSGHEFGRHRRAADSGGQGLRLFPVPAERSDRHL